MAGQQITRTDEQIPLIGQEDRRLRRNWIIKRGALGLFLGLVSSIIILYR